MAGNTVQGLAATHSLFDRIPDAAREHLGEELGGIGRDVLAAQKRDVAKRTGQLSGGLSFQVELERLRVRVGLLGLKGGRERLFYGRIVERGRRAQTVLVQRRRRVDGRLRTLRGRKRAEDIAATYALKVKARAPRPFIRVDRPEIRAEQRLANFWTEVLAKSGRAA